jgi:hypothetical protein
LIASSADFIGLFDWHVRPSKSGSPQSRTCLPAGREIAKRGFSSDSIPPKGGTAIKSRTPSLREEDRTLLMAMAPNDEACIESTETFLFGGISRQTKMLSLRPRRLVYCCQVFF